MQGAPGTWPSAGGSCARWTDSSWTRSRRLRMLEKSWEIVNSPKHTFADDRDASQTNVKEAGGGLYRSLAIWNCMWHIDGIDRDEHGAWFHLVLLGRLFLGGWGHAFPQPAREADKRAAGKLSELMRKMGAGLLVWGRLRSSRDSVSEARTQEVGGDDPPHVVFVAATATGAHDLPASTPWPPRCRFGEYIQKIDFAYRRQPRWAGCGWYAHRTEVR
jgi:hypothetical protein